jgi:hypothetical protein
MATNSATTEVADKINTSLKSLDVLIFFDIPVACIINVLQL